MRLEAALKFTFLVGVFQIGLGLFRLGAIVHYVSYPVMVACNSAGATPVGRTTGAPLRPDAHSCLFHAHAGIIITFISQIKHFLGIKVPSLQYTHETLEYIFTHLGQR